MVEHIRKFKPTIEKSDICISMVSQQNVFDMANLRLSDLRRADVSLI